MHVDLNADLGESAQRWFSGEDRELLSIITSANVCCGAYAGDDDLMRATCRAAVDNGVAIGAQVGYPDRAGFGRAPMDMGHDQLSAEVTAQIARLDAIAQSVGGIVSYVKPHGALYNTIVSDRGQAAAVVAAIGGCGLPLLGLPDSASLALAAGRGLCVVAEGFADRAYTDDGTLVPRSKPGAVLDSAGEVAAQALRLAQSGVESICVHSDSPGAVALARVVRTTLEQSGVRLERFA